MILASICSPRSWKEAGRLLGAGEGIDILYTNFYLIFTFAHSSCILCYNSLTNNEPRPIEDRNRRTNPKVRKIEPIENLPSGRGQADSTFHNLLARWDKIGLLTRPQLSIRLQHRQGDSNQGLGLSIVEGGPGRACDANLPTRVRLWKGRHPRHCAPRHYAAFRY